jgi:hypothetical protein
MLIFCSDGNDALQQGDPVTLSSTAEGYQFVYLFFDADPEAEDTPRSIEVRISGYCTGGGVGPSGYAAIVNVDNVKIEGH